MARDPDNLRSITHDMRNLLSAVRGHAELALRSLSPEDQAREDVAHVVVVTAAIFDLVDQLDGNDSSPTLMATNLDSTVLAMRRLLDALLPTSIEMDLSAGTGGSFVAIPKLRIERIVLNLVLNARDAMEDGGTLTISTTATSEEEAQIVVTDTGTGFSEGALAHLFESGFTTKAGRGGSGHGLPVLQRIVTNAGGAISVDSEPGQGATVSVRIPIVALDEADADGDDVLVIPTATDSTPSTQG